MLTLNCLNSYRPPDLWETCYNIIVIYTENIFYNRETNSAAICNIWNTANVYQNPLPFYAIATQILNHL